MIPSNLVSEVSLEQLHSLAVSRGEVVAGTDCLREEAVFVQFGPAGGLYEFTLHSS